MTLRGVDDLEAAGADFVVCSRVADLPPLSSFPRDVQGLARQARHDSQREPCGRCGEPILVSNRSPRHVARVCSHCIQDIQAIAAKANALTVRTPQ
jgi:hypothetical protein